MNIIRRATLSFCFLFVASLVPTEVFAGKAIPPTIYIYGTIDSLFDGVFDGELTIKEISKKGNLGLGTFNKLDGELVMVDGITYRALADGSVAVASPDIKTPFVQVVPFKPQKSFQLGTSNSLEALEQELAPYLPNKQLFYATKIIGSFSFVSARVVAAQERPYKKLKEASKEQVVFRKRDVQGTLLGVYSPQFTRGISIPEWHWHFISDDHTLGGHVFSLSVKKAKGQITSYHSFEVELPNTEDFKNANHQTDRTAELKQVEQARESIPEDSGK